MPRKNGPVCHSRCSTTGRLTLQKPLPACLPCSGSGNSATSPCLPSKPSGGFCFNMASCTRVWRAEGDRQCCLVPMAPQTMTSQSPWTTETGARIPGMDSTPTSTVLRAQKSDIVNMRPPLPARSLKLWPSLGRCRDPTKLQASRHGTWEQIRQPVPTCLDIISIIRLFSHPPLSWSHANSGQG